MSPCDYFLYLDIVENFYWISSIQLKRDTNNTNNNNSITICLSNSIFIWRLLYENLLQHRWENPVIQGMLIVETFYKPDFCSSSFWDDLTWNQSAEKFYHSYELLPPDKSKNLQHLFKRLKNIVWLQGCERVQKYFNIYKSFHTDRQHSEKLGRGAWWWF